MLGTQPAATGKLSTITVIKNGRSPSSLQPSPPASEFIRNDHTGHVRKGRRKFPMEVPSGVTWRQHLLAFLRDHVNPAIPRMYYQAMIGHPLHVSTWGALKARVYRPNQRDPFQPERIGWWENRGVVSMGLVTVAFRDFEIDQLQNATGLLYDDFSFHEVGTSTAAENNTHTALQTTSGISRVDDGSPTEPAANQYQTVATVTADASETWGEHGLFNASSSGTMMDRSLISPTITVASPDQVQFTYVLTKNAES